MNGQAVGVIEGGMLYLVRSDHIGRPVFATNTLGIKVWEASYLPFGGVHTSTGDPINLRFPGQWFQSEAGLHQNWMRDYDPTTGRYVQGDPLGLIDTASVYGYVRQNPGRFSDPTGLCPWCVAAGVGAVVGVALDYAADQLWGDQCYTLQEAVQAALFGAAFSGAGFAATGVRRAGKEFSHAVPSRTLKKTRFGRWLDKKGNKYRSLNGNYVSPYTHARTDYYRHLPGGTKTVPIPLRIPARTPLWAYGGPASASLPSFAESENDCGC